MAKGFLISGFCFLSRFSMKELNEHFRSSPPSNRARPSWRSGARHIFLAGSPAEDIEAVNEMDHEVAAEGVVFRITDHAGRD